MKKLRIFGLLVLPFLLAMGARLFSNEDMAARYRQELLDIDAAFSACSVREGAAAAFARYCANDAVMYREASDPVSGRTEIAARLSAMPSGATLAWVPTYAAVAASRDLGYTLGTYEYCYLGKNVGGYYVTIWKRVADGSWRFVFDSGVAGPIKPIKGERKE